MNVVEIRQGAGTFITGLEPDLLVEHLDFVFALSDATSLDLLESRQIVEGGLCALAARRITDEELARLDACMKRLMESANDSARFFQADLDLHECIAESARSMILGRFMASIRRLGRASRQRTTDLPGINEQVIADHQAIVKALRARDPEAARAAMLQHLQNIENRLRASMAREDETTTSAEET
jgi:GntR family transcriptional repressor for pyruvate dehydrogenase complex